MKKSVPFLFLVIIFSIASTDAQNTYDFMRLDMSARAGALAGSFVTNNDDPDVIFYNPAGLDLLEGQPVSFSFVKHLLDINLASLSYSQNFENIGRFGAAVKYINYGNFTKADDFGNKIGDFSAGEIAFILGYANALDENFYYGVNVKYIYSSLAEYSSSAIAGDIGLHYAFPAAMMDIGFAVLNLGSQIDYYIDTREKLPLDMVVGISKRLENLPVRLSLDFHKLNEDQNDFFQRLKAFTIGAEFNLSKVLKLRFGYDNEKRSELKVGTTSGIAGFNAGFGAIISGYNFDYGFSSLGTIGSLHRISIGTTF
ncbi:MAG TPA: type IX secretion system protein PorQ [Ignavibacteriaceae bacterium]|nr:type IX secretion system protein PorQ [Ignavibacteriaceae bacterium]